jgi:hypothetical protein
MQSGQALLPNAIRALQKMQEAELLSAFTVSITLKQFRLLLSFIHDAE